MAYAPGLTEIGQRMGNVVQKAFHIPVAIEQQRAWNARMQNLEKAKSDLRDEVVRRLEISDQRTINQIDHQIKLIENKEQFVEVAANWKLKADYYNEYKKYGIETPIDPFVSAQSYAQFNDKLIDTRTKEAQKQQAAAFTQAAQQPIEETRQVQAEGPPIQAGERAGEVPMEQQEYQRPLRTEEYERGLRGLSPEAQKLVPESLGKEVSKIEDIFQRPLKAYEAEREKSIKARESSIKTMTGIDKLAGFDTAIIESQDSSEALKSKQKTVGELIKLTTKMNNLPAKQVGAGKQTEMMMDAEKIAAELDIPQQLATNTDFLGRMNAEIETAIKKEEDQQKRLEEDKKAWQDREQQKLDIDRLKAQQSGAGQGIRGGYLALAASKLSEAEKTQVASVNEGKEILTNLINTYKTSGYGGAGSFAGEAAAKVPIAGKFIAPKHAEYQKQKELASEIWLRAATGAATNPSEIKRYAGFLPDESDPPALSQSKMDNFFTKIMAKVEGRANAIEIEAKSLENQGELELAEAKRTAVNAIKNMILESQRSIPKLVEETPQPARTTTVQHPEASAAEKWAMENPNDPRAAEILKRLGK